MKIDPKKFYSLKELIPYFPWIKSLPTLRKWVHADMRGPNILKAIKVGKGVGTQYHIKGENAIKFRTQIEDQGLTLYAVKGGEYSMTDDQSVAHVNEEVDENRNEDGHVKGTNPQEESTEVETEEKNPEATV